MEAFERMKLKGKLNVYIFLYIFQQKELSKIVVDGGSSTHQAGFGSPTPGKSLSNTKAIMMASNSTSNFNKNDTAFAEQGFSMKKQNKPKNKKKKIP